MQQAMVFKNYYFKMNLQDTYFKFRIQSTLMFNVINTNV